MVTATAFIRVIVKKLVHVFFKSKQTSTKVPVRQSGVAPWAATVHGIIRDAKLVGPVAVC